MLKKKTKTASRVKLSLRKIPNEQNDINAKVETNRITAEYSEKVSKAQSDHTAVEQSI
jgi:hypothetical protein